MMGRNSRFCRHPPALLNGWAIFNIELSASIDVCMLEICGLQIDRQQFLHQPLGIARRLGDVWLRSIYEYKLALKSS